METAYRAACLVEALAGVGVLIAFQSSQHVIASSSLRPFNVVDSIELTRLVDPSDTLGYVKAPQFKFSADGKSVFVATRRGDLEAGETEFRIRVYEVSDILTFLNDSSRAELPFFREYLSWRSNGQSLAVSDATWLANGKQIAFIGQNRQEFSQVYLLDVDSGKTRRLTDHQGDVVAFALTNHSNVLVYSAHVVPDRTDRNRRGYVVRTERIRALTNSDPRRAEPEVKLFTIDLRTNAVVALPVPGDLARPMIQPHAISVSPSGRWVVTAVVVRQIPKRWKDYDFVRELPLDTLDNQKPDLSGGLDKFIRLHDAFSRPIPWLVQYFLVDLSNGTVRELLDAPAAKVSPAGDAAIWSADNRHVILTQSYLPLNTYDALERTRRRQMQSIVEVDVLEDTVTEVAEALERSADGRERLFMNRVHWNGSDSITVHYSALDSPGIVERSFRKSGGRWISDSDASKRLESSKKLSGSRLKLSIVQDANTSPEIGALDTFTGKERAITDLNPQLRKIDLSSVRLFTWQDRLGRSFTGGLLLPQNHVVGKRYAVVIQTYGFNRVEFLVDGPIGITSAFAARPLAGRGLLVLQMPRIHGREQGAHGENAGFLAGLEGAIDALDANGWIDRERVGLIGFSREGMHVQHAVTFSKYRIAAATVADSIAATPFCYALVYGSPYPGMAEWETELYMGMGAPFWGDGIDNWLERSYAFHLENIQTAIRYEKFGNDVDCHWDTYVMLKRQSKPVEMIHIPFASHNVSDAWGRYTSQGSNVDWFAYWLKDEIDAHPSKFQQYERWKRLRAQRDTSAREFQSDGSKKASEKERRAPYRASKVPISDERGSASLGEKSLGSGYRATWIGDFQSQYPRTGATWRPACSVTSPSLRESRSHPPR